MNSALLIDEGDFRFSLPTNILRKVHPDEEKKMKARSESASKTKGGDQGRQVREASKLVPSSSASCGYPREQMIAEAAYFRAEQRGFLPGNEMSDWLQAEADVEAVIGARE